MKAADFYLYFPTEPAARSAGAECETAGYSVDVRLGFDDDWLTQARREIDRADLDEIEEWLDALARRHGGEYDGFEIDV